MLDLWYNDTLLPMGGIVSFDTYFSKNRLRSHISHQLCMVYSGYILRMDLDDCFRASTTFYEDAENQELINSLPRVSQIASKNYSK